MGSATALQWDGGGAGASAIEALGSLFKLTEVYLRDDGSTKTREPLSVTKSSVSFLPSAFFCFTDELSDRELS
ncbi:hypothetical protein CRG98_028941 [Punica granatum]|uniref:Uncharacterized protein n=1 Tax=Punica granatum TaxID=22663 RepID=A0A2I0J325_PUNGR|nr:hypothetical protein CRG98_028941 [Punica granatum]